MEVKEFKRLKMLLLSSRDIQFNLQCHCKVVDYWTDRKLTCNGNGCSSILFNFEDFLLFFCCFKLNLFGFQTQDI